MNAIYRLFNRSYRDHIRDPELLRTLNIIILSAAIGTILFSSSSGAAFTGYASALGAGEFVFGLLSALPVLGCLVQLYVSYRMEKTGKRKRMLMVGGFIQRGVWLVVAFIPYILPEQVAASRIWAVLVLITLSSMAGSFVGVTHMSFMAELVPMEIRGRYVTTRQRIAIIASFLTGLGVARLLDLLPGFLGYTVVFTLGGIAGLVDILLYADVKFPDMKRSEKKFSLLSGFRECFKVTRTRNYMLFWIFWSFTVNICNPFINKYAIDVLSLSFTQIILFGQLTSNILSVLIISRWGVFIDRYGCAPLVLFAGTVYSLSLFLWLPAAPGGILPLLLTSMIAGAIACAVDISSVNMQMSHTPDVGRPLVLSMYAILTSLSAAAASVVGGAFLEWVEPVVASWNLSVAGTPFDNYKLLFCLSVVLRLAALFVFVPRMWNEKGFTIPGAYREILSGWKRQLRHGRAILRFIIIRARKRRQNRKRR